MTAVVEPTRAAARKRRLARTLVHLGAGVIALVVLAVVLRDEHCRRSALQFAERYRRMLEQERFNESGLLPLRLEPNEKLATRTPVWRWEWLEREAASRLRQSEGPVIVAYGGSQGLWLARDGRAVLIFHNRRLDVKWLPDAEFSARWSAQQTELQRLQSEQSLHRP
ncbi:MAG TPA: hypothetical protein PKK06_13215 [Phycisphaerae bacterium]|nr:hypothetical protein [Phycisphaerae bacterium]HNU45693.1 hypothetical protein [Phycisphaerae bacterium]